MNMSGKNQILKAETLSTPENPSEKVIAAVSGGPDSMAMLDLLRRSKIRGFENQSLIVCHVNYHHRPTADRDEKTVRDYCEKYSIPVFVLDADSNQVKGNFQAWARKLRYDFFESAGKRENTNRLVCAHQQDDVIETYLLQKKRSSIPEHYGLQEVSVHGQLVICRPLLECTKKELQEYCTQNRIPFGIDESNLQDEYERNRIRHSVVEKLSEEERNQILLQIQEDNRNLENVRRRIRKLAEEIPEAEIWNNSEYESIRWRILDERISDFCGIHFSEKSLREALRQLESSGHFELWSSKSQTEMKKTAKRKRSDQPEESAESEKSGKVLVVEGFFEKESRNLILNAQRKWPYSDQKQYWNQKSENHCGILEIRSLSELRKLCKDHARIKFGPHYGIEFTDHPRRIESFMVNEEDFPLRVGFPVSGDRIDLRFGSKKISRILMDRKIPAQYRKEFPILRNKHEKVIFMPLTGCDVSHFKENSPFGMVLFSLTNSEQKMEQSSEKRGF